MWLDHWVAACLVPLAVWMLLSGLDDLFIDLVYFLTGRKQFQWPAESELDRTPQRRIAILVPLWREHRVIGRMLERNLSVIRYENYDLFVGVYPNDELTARAVAETARRHPRVHLAPCPHDGPTSKGDCLNWIYRRMTEYESRQGVRFDVVVTHDAEDLIHRESLRLINWFSRSYDMVQVPVLPLPTRLNEFTHGLYCDEFAEYQSKDIPVRQRLSGFLPSNGVGTGFARAALERLGEVHRGCIFDPESLTEDYENGCRLHLLGYRQVFVPIRPNAAAPAATREYFPRSFRSAVRQRSRWVAGIALQGWQFHGWRPWRQIYWFWRDRKGLVGNLLSPAANLLLLYGLSSYLLTARPGQSWHLASYIPFWVTRVYAITFGISLLQVAVRAHCSARVYGWRFAAASPLRIFWGNLLNCVATLAAVGQFVAARLEHRSLAWHKTEHAYPAHRTPEQGTPRLGEVLMGMNRVSTGELEAALRRAPDGLRLGEYLLQLQQISEEHLYQALSSQTGIPWGLPSSAEVNRLATRALPAAAALRWKVMPYRVDAGQLHVVTADVPSEAMIRSLNRLSELEIRFHLVRPNEFADLAREYLLAPPSTKRGQTHFLPKPQDASVSFSFSLIGERLGGAIAKSQLEERTESAARRMEALAGLARTISEEDYLDRILQAIAEMVAKTLDSPVCFIMLVDEDRRELVISAACCSSPNYLHKMPLEIEDSLIGHVVREGRVMVIRDVLEEKQYRYPELARRTGLASLLSVPLMTREKVIGAINLYTREVRQFTEDEIGFVKVVAGQAGIAIENARLMSEALEMKRTLEACKLMERAKAILQHKHNVTEEEA